MAPRASRRGRVRKCPANALELRGWLHVVEEWRASRVFSTPRPRLLLDIIEPGAPWFWLVGCTLERLELEDLSGIPFPLPDQANCDLTGATPSDKAIVASSEGSAPTAHAPEPLPESVTTSQWLCVVEDAMESHSNANAPAHHRNSVSAGCISDAVNSSVSHPSTYPAAIDSEHSCFPPREELYGSWDSYDYRPGMAAVWSYIAEQKNAGVCPSLKTLNQNQRTL